MSERPRLLLIDDDRAVVDLLVAKLSPRYEMLFTTDPRQASAMARTELPDLILCDIDMPGMSGGDVAADLASDSATSRIPLVYLTALVTPDETRAMRGEVGGRPGVSKRATLSQLMARIDAALGAR